MIFRVDVNMTCVFIKSSKKKKKEKHIFQSILKKK